MQTHMTDLYTLDEQKRVVPATGLIKWALWIEENRAACRVGSTHVNLFWVSTMFLGINMGFPEEDLVVWETIVFLGDATHMIKRCSGTWEQAEAMHAQAVAAITTTVQKEAVR